MPDAELSVIDEVEATISTGSAEKRLETIKRVTDLFVSSAGSFNHEQIDLFGDLLERLIKTIEIRAIADVSARIALAEMSIQLAPVGQAPSSVVRRLAMNDEITIAGPVLTESARLSTEDLVEIAETKGEQHLLAVSGRWWLKEVITDALLARRYPSVSRRLISNPGARVSAAGFAIVVAQAESDPELATETGIRVDLPPELRVADPQVRSIVEAQQEVFDTRRTTHASRRDILGQRIEQLVQQIKGYEAQVESASKQLGFVTEELTAKEYLVNRGLIPKPDALRLKRTDAEISGKRGEYEAEIARARQQIGESRMQILGVDAERADQIAADAEKVRGELTDVNEKLQGSADVVKRTVVVAPVNGTVVDVKFKTIGGVVQRGEPIMSIVPVGDELIIEARLTPLDVKAVHSGLEAKIHLSAYSSRIVPKIPGTVRTVSADRLMDDATHQPYYLARVAVDRQTLHRLAPSVDLIPGMPVEVLVVTERRTMMEYLAKPFREALWRSFREI